MMMHARDLSFQLHLAPDRTGGIKKDKDDIKKAVESLDSSQIAQMKLDRSKGVSVSDLSKRYGILEIEVRQLCKGVPIRVITPNRNKGKRIEERNAQLVADHDSGIAPEELSAKYGLTPRTIKQIIYQEKHIPRNWIEAKKRDEKVRARYMEGVSQTQVAREFGLSENLVGKICYSLVEHPEEIRKRDANIRADFADGLSPMKIGKKYGLTVFTISRVCYDQVMEKKIARQKRDARIREMYREGHSINAITHEIELSGRTVWGICKGIKDRKLGKKFFRPNPEKEARNALWRENFRGGKTIRQIAEIFGVKESTVSGVVAGTKRDKRPKDDRNAEIREYWKMGARAIELAFHYGLPPSNIHRLVKGVKRDKVPSRDKLPEFRIIRAERPEKAKRNEKIRTRYAHGPETIPELAHMFELDPSAVRIICYGVKKVYKEEPKPEFSEKEIRVREAYERGDKISDIIETYGVSTSLIYRVCADIERRNLIRNKDSAGPENEIMKLAKKLASESGPDVANLAHLLQLQRELRKMSYRLSIPYEQILEMFSEMGN